MVSEHFGKHSGSQSFEYIGLMVTLVEGSGTQTVFKGTPQHRPQPAGSSGAGITDPAVTALPSEDGGCLQRS